MDRVQLRTIARVIIHKLFKTQKMQYKYNLELGLPLNHGDSVESERGH